MKNKFIIICIGIIIILLVFFTYRFSTQNENSSINILSISNQIENVQEGENKIFSDLINYDSEYLKQLRT